MIGRAAAAIAASTASATGSLSAGADDAWAGSAGRAAVIETGSSGGDNEASPYLARVQFLAQAVRVMNRHRACLQTIIHPLLAQIGALDFFLKSRKTTISYI